MRINRRIRAEIATIFFLKLSSIAFSQLIENNTMKSAVGFVAFGILALIYLTSGQSSEKLENTPSHLAPKFRYISPKADCPAGRLYHDGCSWCECMGEGNQDECDDVPCGENTLGSDTYEPDSEEERRSTRTVKRKRSTICSTVTTFHEHDMECFCRDSSWYWCREPGSNSNQGKRSTRSVEEKPSHVVKRNNICETVSTFHEHDMECFCRDKSWYWCREPGSTNTHNRRRRSGLVKRNNMCETVSTFHEHDMECFCRDKSWYWCREPNSAVNYH